MESKSLYQWDITHAVHDDTLMLWCVLGNTAEVCFEDVISV
jgi:hypothetical protein